MLETKAMTPAVAKPTSGRAPRPATALKKHGRPAAVPSASLNRRTATKIAIDAGHNYSKTESGEQLRADITEKPVGSCLLESNEGCNERKSPCTLASASPRPRIKISRTSLLRGPGDWDDRKLRCEMVDVSQSSMHCASSSAHNRYLSAHGRFAHFDGRRRQPPQPPQPPQRQSRWSSAAIHSQSELWQHSVG